MAAGAVGEAGATSTARLEVTLLGPFTIKLGQQSAGPWYRPPAKRLCELVMLSPGRRVGREMARETLFAKLAPDASAKALSRALSLARQALSPLGGVAAGLLRADRNQIWVAEVVPIHIDLLAHEEALRSALRMEPGGRREAALSAALRVDAVLLEDEPYADWATRSREALELLRQRARLDLARDRARPSGQSEPGAVIEAWEACLSFEPTCEEAAVALVQAYTAQNRPARAESAYHSCRKALGELGAKPSPALEEAWANIAVSSAVPPRHHLPAPNEERRIVSLLSAEVVLPVGARAGDSPEGTAELVGGALAEVVTEVEGLGGTVTALSGTGLVAVFGAPEAHEDDPERAVRAALRSVAAVARCGGVSLRVGVETGPAVTGRVGGGASAYYGIVGEVVDVAMALRSSARPGAVLTGPATRAATEGLFEWGEAVTDGSSRGPGGLAAAYVERPKARPSGQAGRRRLAGYAPLVGRVAEMAVLRQAVMHATAGKGSVVLVAGEPGLGKTRLVQECRKLFMAWVGAATGRLPLWVEGRAISYTSGVPYGVFQQLLREWTGVVPEQGAEAARLALERAMKAAFRGEADSAHIALLSLLLGINGRRSSSALVGLGPEPLQRATFDAVAALIAALVSHGPAVLVLEDLHWADAVSLRLAERLAHITATSPLLILLTRRPEPDPGTVALEQSLAVQPGVVLRRLDLSRLPHDHERKLARELLGRADDTVLEAVRDGAEGNPLFLEERLASLLETRALVKAENGRWLLVVSSPRPLPGAIERLVRSRVDRLSQAARQAVVAASVLGPEFGHSPLGAVAELDRGLDAAVSELCTAGLLVKLPGSIEPIYRFRHGLIQEATYNGLLKQQRRALHARAAWAMEGASGDRADEIAGILAHHFAAAGVAERAGHYLLVAGDRAAKAFANDEAIAFYRQALEVTRTEDRQLEPRAADVAIRLGQLFWRTGRYAEGRAALSEATKLGSEAGPVRLAECYQILAKIEYQENNYDACLAACDRAEELLEANRSDGDDWVAVWLEVQLNRCGVYSDRKQPDLHAGSLGRMQLLAEALAAPAQKARYLFHCAAQRGMDEPDRSDRAHQDYHRASWEVVKQAGLQYELAWVLGAIGACRLAAGDLDQARSALEETVALAHRAGDTSCELSCTRSLAWIGVRQHDIGLVEEMAVQGDDLSAASSLRPHSNNGPFASAARAWVAWKKGNFAAVERLAQEARALCGEFTVASQSASTPYLAGITSGDFTPATNFPLMAVYLKQGRNDEAIDLARELLGPTVPILSGPLDKALRAAVAYRDGSQHHEAATALHDVLRLAEEERWM